MLFLFYDISHDRFKYPQFEVSFMMNKSVTGYDYLINLSKTSIVFNGDSSKIGEPLKEMK